MFERGFVRTFTIHPYGTKSQCLGQTANIVGMNYFL